MNGTSPLPHRTRFERTRTGCLTCRRRRKKCDESRPVCKACHRNNLQCVWPKTSVSVSATANEIRSPLRHCVQNESSPGESDSSEAETHSSTTGAELVLASASSLDVAFAQSRGELNGHIRGRRDGCSLNRAMSSGTSPFNSEISAKLLQHYLARTAGSISINRGATNPFITSIIPVAFVDDLVMNSVLALSGVDFANTQPASSHMQTTAWRHYESVIRGLITSCSEMSTLPCKDALRILLTLMLLCHIEAIAGNTASTMYTHLRAARQVLLYIQTNEGELEARDNDYQTLRNFCCEIYVYLALVSHITPYGLVKGRPIPLHTNDPVFRYLTGIEDNEVAGSLLSCAYKLFPLIPQISSLARQRLIEEETGVCSAQSVSMYEDLLCEIKSWQPPEPHPSMAEHAESHLKAGEIYRNTLLIYLAVSMQPTRTKRVGFIEGYIQTRIDIVMTLMGTLFPAPHETIMLWPTMIVGSCLLKDRQRRLIRNALDESNWMQYGNVARGMQLLELVWGDPDEDVYGPYGLYLMMKKHNLDPCIA